MPTSTPGAAARSGRSGSLKPWANRSRFPGAMPSLISFSQTSACFSSGSRIMIDVAAAGGLGDVEDLEPGGLCLGLALRVRPQADDHRHAGVLQVQRVGVPLGAVAEHGNGLPVELRKVGVEDDLGHGSGSLEARRRAGACPGGCAAAPRRARRPSGPWGRTAARGRRNAAPRRKATRRSPPRRPPPPSATRDRAFPPPPRRRPRGVTGGRSPPPRERRSPPRSRSRHRRGRGHAGARPRRSGRGRRSRASRPPPSRRARRSAP